MDASNPVITGERTTVGEFMNESIMLKRQDYKVLDGLVKDGRRVFVPECDSEQFEVPQGLVKKVLVSGVVKGGEGQIEPDIEVKLEKILVSKFHPIGICQMGANVGVTRKFPQRKRIERAVYSLLLYNQEASQHIERLTFSGGTKAGFLKRLNLWANRKPKLMGPLLKQWGFNGLDILRERMPVARELVDWKKGISELLDGVTVNKTSGAGPPFFQPKHKCFDDVMAALKELVDAISNGTFEQFISKNPELMMSECKNKMDRYETNNIMEKTRPYWSFSTPASLLISILCQSFSSSIYTFDEGKGSNAYGFSYAHGGAKKLWEWMNSTKEGETKFIVYGDDTKMVWRKNGILYEVNPDFVQMDGSVDRDTVDLTVDYVIKCFEKQHGNSEFFKFVGEMWKKLALGSSFFLDGTKAYSNKTGLLTGVVGTTLFDTVKSMLAYHLFIHQRNDPSDVEKSTAFFKEMGLEVKKNTWQPEMVIEDLEEGVFASEQKFLGVKMMTVQGGKEPEPVPFMDEDDLIALIGNLRQQVVETGATALNRRLFDTARGYMITAAFHHPRLWSSMGKLIDDTDPKIICQRVQARATNGELPELQILSPKDFRWPSSDGFPSKNFCYNVYLSGVNQREEADWMTVFPDLARNLAEFRKGRIYINPEPKERSDLWNEVGERTEQLIAKFDSAVDPVNRLDDVEVLPQGPFRMPKKVAMFRHLTKEQMKRKETKMYDLLFELEEIHHQVLSAVVPYGDHWVTRYMLSTGYWFPTSNGMWTRDKNKKAKHVTSSWSHECRVAMSEKEVSTPSPSQPSIQPEPDIAAVSWDIVEPDLLEQLGQPNWNEYKIFRSETMDSISFVTSLFGVRGMLLETKTKVLTQAPSRVEAEVWIKGQNKRLGTAVFPSAKEGKRRIFSELEKAIEELRMTYGQRNGDGNESEEKESVSVVKKGTGEAAVWEEQNEEIENFSCPELELLLGAKEKLDAGVIDQETYELYEEEAGTTLMSEMELDLDAILFPQGYEKQ